MQTRPPSSRKCPNWIFGPKRCGTKSLDQKFFDQKSKNNFPFLVIFIHWEMVDLVIKILRKFSKINDRKWLKKLLSQKMRNALKFMRKKIPIFIFWEMVGFVIKILRKRYSTKNLVLFWFCSRLVQNWFLHFWPDAL